MSNKVKYGLKNVHYAVVTETDGEITYDTPKPIRGAVNLTLDAAGESVQFYADDSVYYEENTNDGYTGSLEMALIPDEFRVDVLGDELDANGALIENKDAKAKHFALLFEFDGDAKKTRPAKNWLRIYLMLTTYSGTIQKPILTARIYTRSSMKYKEVNRSE